MIYYTTSQRLANIKNIPSQKSQGTLSLTLYITELNRQKF